MNINDVIVPEIIENEFNVQLGLGGFSIHEKIQL
jgi:hypothetical protein